MGWCHRLNVELDLQSLFGLHAHSFTHWLRPRNTPPPPSPRIWAHIRGRSWSAKIDDISLWPPGWYLACDSYLFKPESHPKYHPTAEPHPPSLIRLTLTWSSCVSVGRCTRCRPASRGSTSSGSQWPASAQQHRWGHHLNRQLRWPGSA